MSKEYIERGALIAAVDAMEFLTMQDAETALQLVTEAPAADVEPVVRGEWVQNTDGKWACSACDCPAISNSYDGENWQYNTIRCPNCGAHMDERSDT